MIPSQYQSAIFSFIQKSSGSAIISAVAGSGKSTTLVQAVGFLPPGTDYRFLAFNKAIAEDLKSKGVEKASTFHSLLFAELNSRLSPRPKVDSAKVRNLFKAVMPDDEQEDYWDIIKLVSLAKNSAYAGCESNDDWEALIEEFDLEFPDNDHAIAKACRILDLSNSRLDVVDFDDMLYIPYIKNWKLRTYPVIFIDEAQDTNALQLALLTRIMAPGGRIIAVGDQAQAIYGFRGAGRGSMDFIRDAFSCTPLPLSISYRCSKSVVAFARQYVPQIEAFRDAPLGSVDHPEEWAPTTLPPGSAIICRINRPLIKLAYRCIRAGVSVQMLGRDLGGNLKTMLKKHRGANMETLTARLELERTAAVERALAKSRSKAAVVEDRYDSLFAVIESQPATATTEDVCDSIDRIFRANPGASITLCTVHRSKGLEWPNVFILDASAYMPHPRANEGWALQQEYNLIYVAATRAKINLAFINSPK